jgi:arylsulfatase A-like enzyme
LRLVDQRVEGMPALVRAGVTALTLVVALLAVVPPARRTPPRHVVLVTVDTLRADRLGLYGHDQPTSPWIDALARESVVFENALATCPATAPSVASLLTGLHRAAHGVIRNSERPLARDVRTLAEILKAHGWRTAACVANPVLDAQFGFARGFDDFSVPPASTPGGVRGATVVAEAARLLDAAGDAPLFLWLHLMDPHGPYLPPEPYGALFAAEDYRWPGETDLPVARSNYVLRMIPRYQAVGTSRAAADYRARYDGEIRYTDDNVRAIVSLLRARGLWDDTLFVLTADHGESLGEHGYYFQHGWFAYDDALRVPLLLRTPGLLPAGRRVAATVSLVDVTPTVLDLLGVPAAEPIEGRSLLPLVGGPDRDRAAFAQTYYGHGLVALRRGRFKYIATQLPDRDGREPAVREELYDLTTDPGETRNLAPSRVALVRELGGKVRAWLARQGEQGRPPAEVAPVDPRTEGQLRALGYVD